ncbi:hypothetical protein JCM8547_001344 [Rhodosporidiobolus lusitaniae]
MLPTQLNRRTTSSAYRPQPDEPTAAPPARAESTTASPPPLSQAPVEQPEPVQAAQDDDEQQCWICYESSSESSEPFVHICQCSLVSHERCSLRWFDAQSATQAAPPKCPVCAAPITIKEERSEFLRVYRKLRRNLDSASLAAAVGAVGASGWFVSAAYGAWVVKMFMGEQVAQALLLRHEKGLPWRYWLNLPLIPFTLILSRTPLIDSLLPFLPLTLVLSTHSHSSLLSDPLGLDDLTLRFPPSPTLTVCLLPWLRLFYLRMRLKVFAAVLGRKKKYRGLAGVFEEAAEDELVGTEAGEGGPERREPLELVATIEVDVDPIAAAAPAVTEGDTQADQLVQQQQQQNQQQQQPLPLSARLRVGLGRLTSLVLGALLFPALSSLAGSALFWLACRRGSSQPLRLLRRVLGVSAVLAASKGAGGAGGGGAGGWVRQLILSPSRSFLGALGGGPVDPVWVRNTLGAGIVLLLRDAVELTAGVLENRRKASRKVVERPFLPSAAAASRSETPEQGQQREEGRTTSAGRDGRGREARVTTLL